MREDKPSSEEQLGSLAGILLRLDRAANYPELVAQVQGLGEHAWPVCAEIVQQVGDKDRARLDILRRRAYCWSNRSGCVKTMPRNGYGSGRRWCKACIWRWAESMQYSGIRRSTGICDRMAGASRTSTRVCRCWALKSRQPTGRLLRDYFSVGRILPHGKGLDMSLQTALSRRLATTVYPTTRCQIYTCAKRRWAGCKSRRIRALWQRDS